MTGRSDQELVAAIEVAYHDDYRRFLRVAVAILGDADRGRDAVQETFVRALRSRRDLRRADSLGGWLWRTLVNVCRIESRHPTLRLAESWDAPGENGHADDWAELRATVAALPERQRLVLFLRHYADLDYRQIAAATGIERGTVAATLHHAHDNVRAALAREVST
jgi:RNA polymerase sigma factor (sigma-70 family)